MSRGEPRRSRTWILLGSMAVVATAFIEVATLSAQGFPARPGQRVRVTAPELFDLRPIGTLEELGVAELFVQLEEGPTLLRIPYRQLHCLEASVGPDRQAGRVLGSIVGAVGWIAAMTIADLSYDGTTGPNMGYIWTPAFAFAGWHLGARLNVGEQWLPVGRPGEAPHWDCQAGPR